MNVQGCASKLLESGIRYAVMHYTADEDKRGPWASEFKKGIEAREWDREMELVETTYDGQPIYPAWVDAYHAPVKYRENRIPLIERSTYFGGWDCGQTLTPAFVLLQVTPKPFQVHAILEVVSNGGEAMSSFAPRVMAAIMARLPGAWPDVRHYGDATVTQRSGSNGATAQQEASRHGMVITPQSNIWAPRLSAVNWLLMREIAKDTPGFMVDGSLCPTLLEGFRGAYQYRTAKSGDQIGPGAEVLMPAKNMYSHIHDALQYPAMVIRNEIEGYGATMDK